jgi:predicted GIY-YIG superfamily endonuclease
MLTCTAPTPLQCGASVAKSLLRQIRDLLKLVYYECGNDVSAAIFREKQIKAGSRRKKIELVRTMNPEWKDLYQEFFR